MQVEKLSAITLATRDMAKALAFYAVLGFRTVWSAPDQSFVTVKVGDAWLNLFLATPEATWGPWGRYILHVDDVDAFHTKLIEAGYQPAMAPSDAAWGERYFHILDPDGHEVSLAKRLRPPRATGSQ
ncbi:MAG: VOC family protein [Chloroflexi bacterium]|nr:VOC family protein [Chloroflexota bacterium]MDA1146493.1 VOC family protein [Chloroflexota bacterium]